MIHLTFEQAYRDLVQAWERHHHLRNTEASFAELIDSRRDLDRKRLTASRLRSQLSR